MDLADELGRLASASRLVVASDFDGTLAPIADDPASVRVDRPALSALRGLATLGRTAVAIISGRDRTTLSSLLGPLEQVQLIGSHGAEWPNFVPDVDPAIIDRTARALERVATGFRGALVERKVTGVAFHYRRVRADRRSAAASEAAEVARTLNMRTRAGHYVVELVAIDTHKGHAIDRLRSVHKATSVVYVGDDVTDEDAFRHMNHDDLSIRVGGGATEARARLAGQGDVAGLFGRLRDLRAESLGRGERPPSGL